MFTVKNILILIGRNALISLAAISVAAIAIIFLSGKITRISDSISLNHRLEAELKKRVGLSDVLERDAQIIGTNDIQIENAFPLSENILEFVNILDSLAAKNGITQTYRFATPELTNIAAPFTVSTIPYSNNIETNVPTFLNYLKEFEKLPYFTKIDGFEISSQDPLGWMGTSTILLRATLYTKTIQ